MSMMLFGFPGVGKTPLIGTQPKTLILRPPTDHTDAIARPENVREMIIKDWASELEAFQYVHQEGWKEFDWVWLDSISVFQDYGLRDVLEDAITRKASRAIIKGGVKIPEFGADVGEYGINMTRLSNTVQDFCGMATEGKINFGLVAHPEPWYDPVDEETKLAPWIQGKGMIPKICGYMNIIGYLRGGKQQILYTNGEGFFGKDQYGAFPKLKSGKRGLVNPTMPKVIDLLEAVRETPAEEQQRKDEVKKRAKKLVKKKAVKKARKG